jgi:predicted nucleotidyltransferase
MAIFEWESRVLQDLVSFLREEMLRRIPSVTAAFVFGSVARGDMGPASDIDVAVLCPAEATEGVTVALEEISERVGERFGNQLSVIVADASLDELQTPRRSGSRLWRRIVREGIPVIEPREAPVGG